MIVLILFVKEIKIIMCFSVISYANKGQIQSIRKKDYVKYLS